MVHSNIPMTVNPVILSFYNGWITNLKVRLSERISVLKHPCKSNSLPRLYRKETDVEGYWIQISWVLYWYYCQCAILPFFPSVEQPICSVEVYNMHRCCGHCKQMKWDNSSKKNIKRCVFEKYFFVVVIWLY